MRRALSSGLLLASRRGTLPGLAPTSRSFVTQGPKSNASLFNLGGRTFSTTPNPPETKTTDHESFMTRFISGMETGNFDEDILNTTFETLVEASTKLVGATANSTAALVFMVPLLRLMIGARTNQPYSVSIEKLKQVRLGQLVTDGHLMLFRRVVASIMPAIFTQTTGLIPFTLLNERCRIPRVSPLRTYV